MSAFRIHFHSDRLISPTCSLCISIDAALLRLRSTISNISVLAAGSAAPPPALPPPTPPMSTGAPGPIPIPPPMNAWFRESGYGISLDVLTMLGLRLHLSHHHQQLPQLLLHVLQPVWAEDREEWRVFRPIQVQTVLLLLLHLQSADGRETAAERETVDHMVAEGLAWPVIAIGHTLAAVRLIRCCCYNGRTSDTGMRSKGSRQQSPCRRMRAEKSWRCHFRKVRRFPLTTRKQRSAHLLQLRLASKQLQPGGGRVTTVSASNRYLSMNRYLAQTLEEDGFVLSLLRNEHSRLRLCIGMQLMFKVICPLFATHAGKVVTHYGI
eukprot:PDM74716.1 hypothetical protein PRIPAC_43667 [Pristionchus pacificus]